MIKKEEKEKLTLMGRDTGFPAQETNQVATVILFFGVFYTQTKKRASETNILEQEKLKNIIQNMEGNLEIGSLNNYSPVSVL